MPSSVTLQGALLTEIACQDLHLCASLVSLPWNTSAVYIPRMLWLHCDRKAFVCSVKLMSIALRCQSFSAMGLGKGLNDKRSKPLVFIMQYVKERLPPILLLENVQGLLTHHGNVLEEAAHVARHPMTQCCKHNQRWMHVSVGCLREL